MASTINATTSGVVTTGDSVATLALQTGGTTAVAIDTAQIVSLSKSLALLGSTSGSVTIAAPAVAGSTTITLPATSGTLLQSGTAVTVAQGGTGLTSGTSGGVPYFSGTSALSSSAALTQYGVVYGGGVGNAPVATAAGTTGQFLGANTGGAPTWQTPTAGAAGSNTQVQFNDGGTALGGDAGLTYNKTTDDLTLAGNLVISTSGKGIDFSATPGTGTSELLADYEEGTWTPTDASGAGLTFTTFSLTKYTKIGRMVQVSGFLAYPATANGSNALIGGLPFTEASSTQSATTPVIIPGGTITSLGFQTSSGSTTFKPVSQPAGTQYTNAQMSNAAVAFSLVYTAS